MDKKKILFLGLTFPPIDKNTNLYTDLMYAFHEMGHEVTVIAPDEEDRKSSELVNEHGIQVLRVPTLALFGKNKIVKGLSNVLLSNQYKRAFKRHGLTADFDTIIIPTPPITLIDFAVWIKKKSKAKLYLILRDIFPQNAVDLDMMKKGGMIYNYFRKKEKKLYDQSDSIGCMSPANIEFVKKHNPEVAVSKLHLLPNWEKIHEWPKNQDENALRKKYGLENRIIAIFGGNVGIPQRVENIIFLAEQCQELKDLVFFIVGRGTEKDKIRALIADRKINNVILKDNLPRKDYNDVLALADIGLISLNQDFTIPNFPSKVNAYYCFKKPVLASVDVNTDFGSVQEEIGAGFWSPAGDTEAFKKNLMKLYSDLELRKTMGENGYKYMKEHLTPEKACLTILGR